MIKVFVCLYFWATSLRSYCEGYCNIFVLNLNTDSCSTSVRGVVDSSIVFVAFYFFLFLLNNMSNLFYFILAKLKVSFDYNYF